MPPVADNRRTPTRVGKSSNGPSISARGLCGQELLPGAGMSADADVAPVSDSRPELSLRSLPFKRQPFVVFALLLGRDGHSRDRVMLQVELLPVRRPGMVDLQRQCLALLGSPRARHAEGVLVLEPEAIIPRLYRPPHVVIDLLAGDFGGPLTRNELAVSLAESLLRPMPSQGGCLTRQVRSRRVDDRKPVSTRHQPHPETLQLSVQMLP